VTIKDVKKTSENIQIYYDLMTGTTQRKWFSGNTLKYYSDFLHEVSGSELLLAYYEGRVIAWWIFVFGKEVSIYYYGASTWDRWDKKLMAPYLLQWEAIKRAKSLWWKYYDFLGVAPPWIEGHPLSWVTDFKKKFTHDIRKVSEWYICVTRPFMYKALLLLRLFKWFVKRVKSALFKKSI
jgi:lipid II:glycine glycyltransferase (peptidoglycan interpeptide bridge formation enzyme)